MLVVHRPESSMRSLKKLNAAAGTAFTRWSQVVDVLGGSGDPRLCPKCNEEMQPVRVDGNNNVMLEGICNCGIKALQPRRRE